MDRQQAVITLYEEAVRLQKQAERYEKVRHCISGRSGLSGNSVVAEFHLSLPTMPGQNIMKGSVAQHFDKAVDAYSQLRPFSPDRFEELSKVLGARWMRAD